MKLVQKKINATPNGSILNSVTSVFTSLPKLMNALFIVLAIVAFFPLYRFIKGQIQTNHEQDTEIDKTKIYNGNKDPSTQQQRADKITKSKELQAVAKQLAHDLGTKYSDQNSQWTSPSTWYIFNPSGWTENDKEVRVALVKYRNYYSTLKRLYHDCYSNSRNLSDDVIEKLDADDMAILKRVLKLN